MGLESDLRDFITSTPELAITITQDNTTSKSEIDFVLDYRGRSFAIDCKEKKSKNRKEWSEASGIPIEDIMIFDELGCKKLFTHYPAGFFLIYDQTEKQYAVFTCFDLLVMPRYRVNRPTDLWRPKLKGKWIVDIRWGMRFLSMHGALAHIIKFVTEEMDRKQKQTECIGNVGILSAGYVRTRDYLNKDVAEK